MREIDRRAREEFGIPEVVLMEHAGTVVAQEALQVLKKVRPKGTALVLAGGGANGGDGFVAARHLDNWNFPVEVFLLADPGAIRGAAQVNLAILRRLKVPVKVIDSWEAWERLVAGISSPGVIIDALLGTGFSGKVREPIRCAIQWMNHQRCPILAVDLPSGLCADTGRPQDIAVRAALTITCGLPKVGLTRGEGRHFSGKVRVADISLPRGLRG